jgi:hypothetical protein
MAQCRPKKRKSAVLHDPLSAATGSRRAALCYRLRASNRYEVVKVQNRRTTATLRGHVLATSLRPVMCNGGSAESVRTVSTIRAVQLTLDDLFNPWVARPRSDIRGPRTAKVQSTTPCSNMCSDRDDSRESTMPRSDLAPAAASTIDCGGQSSGRRGRGFKSRHPDPGQRPIAIFLDDRLRPLCSSSRDLRFTANRLGAPRVPSERTYAHAQRDRDLAVTRDPHGYAMVNVERGQHAQVCRAS